MLLVGLLSVLIKIPSPNPGYTDVVSPPPGCLLPLWFTKPEHNPYQSKLELCHRKLEQEHNLTLETRFMNKANQSLNETFLNETNTEL